MKVIWLGKFSRPDWNRVSVSVKIKKVQIPAIPICSAGPVANGTAQQLFFSSHLLMTQFSLSAGLR